jgi:hypothetical protein
MFLLFPHCLRARAIAAPAAGEGKTNAMAPTRLSPDAFLLVTNTQANLVSPCVLTCRVRTLAPRTPAVPVHTWAVIAVRTTCLGSASRQAGPISRRTWRVDPVCNPIQDPQGAWTPFSIAVLSKTPKLHFWATKPMAILTYTTQAVQRPNRPNCNLPSK